MKQIRLHARLELHGVGIPLPEQHFAFAVADLDALRERLGTLDIRVSVPMEIPGICRQAFTRDPSGNLVEFNQRL